MLLCVRTNLFLCVRSTVAEKYFQHWTTKAPHISCCEDASIKLISCAGGHKDILHTEQGHEHTHVTVFLHMTGIQYNAVPVHKHQEEIIRMNWPHSCDSVPHMTCLQYILRVMHLTRYESQLYIHTHLWWSVAGSPSRVVPVELSQNRVACLHFGHLQGRVKVRELHCKLLSMVTDQGGLTTTLSGCEEVARWMNEGEQQRRCHEAGLTIFRPATVHALYS